jgi:hypothetical protein
MRRPEFMRTPLLARLDFSQWNDPGYQVKRFAERVRNPGCSGGEKGAVRLVVCGRRFDCENCREPVLNAVMLQTRPGRGGWVWVLGVALCAVTTVAAVPRALWVAPDGDDGGPGTRARPLATLKAARDRVRDARQAGDWPRGGVTVWMRGGVYWLEEGLELTPGDSGAPGAPMVYRSVAGERVILSGGRPIHFERPQDSAVLARLGPVARAAVKVADLRGLGSAGLGALVSRGFGRSVTPAHLELFYGGRPMTLARWPNEGEWTRIAGMPAGATHGDEHGGELGALETGFHLDTDRPRRWQASTNIWAHGYWAWDWANSYERVAAFELESRWVRTAPPHGLYGFRKGQRLYFLNVLEELDTPGEFYLEAGTGRLYFWEPLDAPGAEAVVSVLESPLITLSEAAHVIIQGLGLEAGRGSGIVIRGGRHNQIVGCRLRNLGNHGIVIEGGYDHEVLSCDVLDTGDGGVIASGGDRRTLSPGAHLIENSRFLRQGRWSKCYVPAIQFQGMGLLARHNLIRDHPHCGILFGGNDHRIEFNEIHRVALETGDVGAIYTGRDWTYRGNRIVHNYIHETGGVGMGSMGVYMDDCISGAEIYGNVFRRVQRAVFLGGGRDHRVENNLFIDCHPAVAMDGRGLDRAPVWSNMVYRTMKDRLGAVPGDLYRARYPAIADLDPFYERTAGIPPEGNQVRRNVSVGGEWLHIYWHARTNMVELSDNLWDADPLIVNCEGGDFRFRRDSPAWKLGFRPIPFDKIGLYRNATRRELERVFDDPGGTR